MTRSSSCESFIQPGYLRVLQYSRQYSQTLAATGFARTQVIIFTDIKYSAAAQVFHLDSDMIKMDFAPSPAELWVSANSCMVSFRLIALETVSKMEKVTQTDDFLLHES
jgi:hypothetical protein